LDTFETLRQIILGKFELDASAITPGTQLNSLGIDSLHAFEIIFEAEETFGIKLPYEIAPVKTIQDVIDLIDETRASQGK